MDALDKNVTQDKRKKKEDRRREVKLQRKNRLQEKSNQAILAKGEAPVTTVQDHQKLKEKQILRKRESGNRELLTEELMANLRFTEKLNLVKSLSAEIIAYPAFSYRKLKDLLMLCSDNNIDVVLKCTGSLCDLFCDILPDYRIRQLDDAEDKKEKISKEIMELRAQEQTLLECYREYLTVLETFSKLKTSKLTKEETAVINYDRLKALATSCFCRLLERHPQFNYRINILQTIASKLSNGHQAIRRVCTQTLKNLLKKDDNQLLELKLDILKEIHKTIKSKSHDLFEPSLLDCLVLHEIMVDEGKARAVDNSNKNAQQLHDQLQKLRKKGKFKEYKDMRDSLMGELKETDAIGIDLGKVSKTNNLIIKETLAIYFEIIKEKKGSPLLRSVFLGLGQFTKYVNIEIVWDLINVMREYFKIELLETTQSTRDQGISNILAGLLCAFQIMDVGAGSVFNVDEKDFTNALYTVILRMYEQPRHPKMELKDYLALLKCLDLVFIQKKQLSAELINSFVKRLAILQIHQLPVYQTATLFLIKQMLNKYPSARSQMLEIEDDSVNGGFGITPRTAMYKAEINDPQLSNAGQTHVIFEMLHTLDHWQNYVKHNTGNQQQLKVAQLNLKLAKCILTSDSLPQELLTETPSKLLQQLVEQQQSVPVALAQ